MAKFELLLLAMIAVAAFAYPSAGYGAERVIRAADPDPHHRHRSYYSDYYDSDRRYGGYDGYNRDRYYNQQPYQTQPYYGNRGGGSQASAAAGSYGGLSFAAANSQAGSYY